VNSPFTPYYLETEVDQERIGVTLWDSQGLEKKFVDLQLREMSSFLESKFEDTFNEESKVVRAPGVRDTHIHCVFLILDPSRLDSNLAHSRRHNEKSSHRFDEPLRLMGILDEDLDIQVLKTLQGKTTVIPVISKADTITANHMGQLKRAVWDSLKQAKLDPLEALQFGDDDDSDNDRLDERDEDAAFAEADYDGPGSDILSSGNEYSDEEMNGERHDHPSDTLPNPRARPQAAGHRRSPSGLSARLSQAAFDASSMDAPYLPMSIISPDTYEPGVVGRKFPWGFADPYNADHCDFVRLKDSVFTEWRGELREASREIWYEGWRTSRLNRLVGTPNTKPATAGNGSTSNGRSRQASGAASAKSAAGSMGPYGGGPVGHHIAVPPPGTAYSTSPPMSNGIHSPMSPMSAHSTSGVAMSSHPGSPEMVKGVYVQGVNAF
jgi:septin family protein